MADNGNGWKGFALNIALTVAMAALGALYANASTRLERLEAAQAEMNQAKTDIAVLKENVLQMKDTLEDIEKTQDIDHVLLANLVDTTNRNARSWAQALAQYERALKK